MAKIARGIRAFNDRIPAVESVRMLKVLIARCCRTGDERVDVTQRPEMYRTNVKRTVRPDEASGAAGCAGERSRHAFEKE